MKIIAITFLLALSANAMALSQTQKDTLRPVILAEPSIAACVASDNDTCVSEWLNSISTYVGWKTRLTEQEIIEDPGFNFTLVDGLTAGKRDEWSNFIFKGGFCDPSKSNIRAGFVDVWSGTAAKNAVQAIILELSKRLASQAEKALAVGTGTGLTPGIFTFEGMVSINDVAQILRP